MGFKKWRMSCPLIVVVFYRSFYSVVFPIFLLSYCIHFYFYSFYNFWPFSQINISEDGGHENFEMMISVNYDLEITQNKIQDKINNPPQGNFTSIFFAFDLFYWLCILKQSDFFFIRKTIFFFTIIKRNPLQENLVVKTRNFYCFLFLKFTCY